MKVAVVGSRSITYVDLQYMLPPGTDTIVSGAAQGIDTIARDYANAHGLSLIEIRPDYPRYGGAAPLVRNRLIAQAADALIAIWDGVSTGTMHTVKCARERNIPVTVYRRLDDDPGSFILVDD